MVVNKTVRHHAQRRELFLVNREVAIQVASAASESKAPGRSCTREKEGYIQAVPVGQRKVTKNAF